MKRFIVDLSSKHTVRPAGAPRSLAVTRRAFLRASAGGVLLVVAAAPIVSACEGSTPGWRLLLSDPALCGACRRCAITCSALRAGGPGAARGRADPDRHYQALSFVSGRWFAESCHMCPTERLDDGRLVAPACVANCPTGAAQIVTRPVAGVGELELRVIDEAACVGCGSCVRRCPREHPVLFDGVAHKCDLCVGHYDEPPCVEACPASALRMLDFWTDEMPRPFPWEAGGGENGSGTEVGGDG